MPDEELVEVSPESAEHPSEQSLIRKAKHKMDEIKLLERLIPPVVAAVLGVSGGVASSKVKDADYDAVVQSSREEILALKADLQLFRSGFLQRVDVEEREREEDVEKLRDRVIVLETLLRQRGIEPPAEAAPVN